MTERSRDWMNQAKRDMQAAERMSEEEFFEWACFASQQAAERAIKAVLQKLNVVAWEHSVFDLLRMLSMKSEVGDEFRDYAKTLDKYYVAARDPSAFESGSPCQHFTKEEAENAISCGRRILELCEGLLAQLR